MSRLIKEYLEVGDHQSLDDLIAQLEAVRQGMPEGAKAVVKMRGNEVYGRHLCVVFDRPLNKAEADCEGRYAGRRVKLRAA